MGFKILILSNCDLVTSQGSGYVITGFASGLKDLGWDVRAIGPADLAVLPRVSKAQQHRLTLGMWQKGRRFIEQYQPDVVELYGGTAWLATLLISMRRQRPFLIAAHSNGIETFATHSLNRLGLHNTLNGRPPRLLQRVLAPLTIHAFTKADVLVTVSTAEKIFALEQRYQPEDKVLALDNALPRDFLGQSSTGNNTKVIGYCGSWIARKGIRNLAEALVIVLRDSPEWTVELVGVGGKFRKEDHFPSILASRIKVVPFVEDKTSLREVYRSWSIAVMPSLYESFGLVAAEAMACGCALVSTRTGFAANLNENVEACLVDTTSNSLAIGILGLINDPEQRRKIAQAGQRRVQTLRWQDNVQRLNDFYVHHLHRRLRP